MSLALTAAGKTPESVTIPHTHKAGGKTCQATVQEPRMINEDRSVAPPQIFDSLPTDIQQVILSHSDVTTLSLGQTSKYWNDTVNQYLKNDKAGRAI